MALHVGVCGWCRSQDEVLADQRVLEDQKTFYKPPKVETAKRWQDKAPEGFAFTVKAWQLITHPASSPTYRKVDLDLSDEDKDECGYLRDTPTVRDAWKATREIFDALEAAYVLLQCPPSFGPSQDNVANLETFVEEVADRPLAWEPRGDWEEDPGKIGRLCDRLDLVHATDPFVVEPQTDEVRYLRLHGSPPGDRRYYYTYTGADLDEILRACEGGRETWVLFNNRTMFEDAIRFRDRAAEAGFEVA